MDRIRILVHDRAEVDTPKFDRFLRDAVKAYLDYVATLQADPGKAEPWKTDGKQWHLTQRRMVRRHRAAWQGTTLPQLIGAMRKAVGKLEVDWNHKIAVVLKHPAVSGWWCRIITAHRDRIGLQFRAKPGQFTPAMIDRIGPSPVIKRNGRGGGDEIWTGVKDMHQIDPRAFGSFLKAYHAGACEAFPAGHKQRKKGRRS